MRFHVALLFSLTGLAAAAAPATASGDARQAAVSAFYSLYIRDGGISSKDVADFKPYLAPALYALWKARLSSTPGAGAFGYECSFDSDPVANTQNGAPVEPIALGTPVAAGASFDVPVGVSLRFPSGVVKNATRLIAVVETDGKPVVADLIPVVDGKKYPKDSLYSNLLKFKKDPNCRF